MAKAKASTKAKANPNAKPGGRAPKKASATPARRAPSKPRAAAAKSAGPASLATYRKKRDFHVTSEPPPDAPAPPPARGAVARPSFVVHKHDATRLHYDLRLEIEGALASWAVPKGPSYNPKERRLAVETEDHPLAYGAFEGRIPEGEYGAGDSIIWDRGTYETVPPGQATAMRKKGHLEFVLSGEKLAGRWHLVRTRAAGGKAQWILFKARDEHASDSYDVVASRPESVASGKRVTRGPARKAVKARAAATGPVALLMALWPPAQPTSVEHLRGLGGWLVSPYGAGPRAIAAIAAGRVALQSEEGRDLAGSHLPLARALARLPVTEAVIDGEIAPQEEGAALVAHDLLWLDGEDLRDRPIEERRDLLTGLAPATWTPGGARAASAAVRTAPLVPAEARAARPAQGVALLARSPGSPYPRGRARDWVILAASAKPALTRPGSSGSRRRRAPR